MAFGRVHSHIGLHAATITAVGIGLYASSLHSYILFHSLVEVTTIAIAFSLFILTWNTRRFLPDGCLKTLGIGYGFIAGLDLLHTLAYKGMGVFPSHNANLPTQLWIIARFLQAALLCQASVLVRRKLNEWIFSGICLVSVALATSLVFLGAFPDCFIEGTGLTPFKIVSEYVISAILVVALLLFRNKRAAFVPRVYLLLILSILCTIGSELSFTAYLSVYGPANAVGHILKLAAFYCIYQALVVTGLKEPFELIFKELTQSQDDLIREREFGRALLESMADGVVACDGKGILTLFNRTAREWHGVDPIRLPQEKWAQYYDLFKADGVTPLSTEEIPLARAFRGEEVKDAGMAIVAKGQAHRFILANGSRITDAEGRQLGAVVVMRDITAFRMLEQELRRTNEDLERRVNERTEELRASEERFRTLFEGAPDALLIADLNTGTIVDANPSAEQLFGRTREALVGSHQSELHPAAMEERTKESFRAHSAEARSGKRCGPFEHVILHSDGSEIPVEIVTHPVMLAGRPMVQGAFRDISERKRAEDEMRRLNRELRAISSCNQTLMKAEDEQTLLNDVCRIICDEAGYHLAWAGYVEHDRGKTIRPAAWAGIDGDYVTNARISWSENTSHGRGPAGIAVRSGEPVYVEDFANDPRMAPWWEAAQSRGFRSGIALPLKDEQATVFGILMIYATKPSAITAQEFALLQELAGDLAFGITVLRNRAELKRPELVAQARLRMLEAAHAADTSFDDLLQQMLDEIERQTGSCIGFYHFLNEDQQTLSLQTWSANTLANLCSAKGKGMHYPLAKAGVWADCVRERQPVIHNDYASLPHRKGMPEGHAKVVRELVVPIFRGPRIEAIIGVGNKATEYTEADVQSALLLGDFSWEIATRKRAEESLRRREEDLRIRETMLNESQRVGQVGGWDWDAVDDRIWWSDEYYRIYGFEPGTAPPGYEDHLQAYTPESAVRLDAAVKRAMELGEPYELDLELANPTQTTRWIVARGEVKRDENGGIRGLRGTAQNITERKRAEGELRRLNERFVLAADAAGLGLWDWDIRKNELVWDDRMYDLYGLKREDFAGAYEAWLAGIHPDDRAACDTISEQARRGEREYDTEFRVVWPDGSIHILKAYGRVVRGADGTPLRMIGINFDITRRKLDEEEIRSLNEALELRVRERTTELEGKNRELERMNRLFVGRELKMIELKKRIREREKEPGNENTANEDDGQ